MLQPPIVAIIVDQVYTGLVLPVYAFGNLCFASLAVIGSSGVCPKLKLRLLRMRVC